MRSKNVTGGLVMFGIRGQVWARNEQGIWNVIDLNTEEGRALLSSLNIIPPPITLASNGRGLSSGAVAAISIVVTVVLGVLIVLFVFVGCRAFKRHKRPREGSQVFSNPAHEPEDSTSSA